MDTMRRWDQLSPVERRIAELLLRGKTNKEIGVEIFLSRARVQEYARRIVAKTGAANTRHAITLLAEERELSLLMQVLNQAEDGVTILQDGFCKYANRALASSLGYSPEEMVGKPFLEMVAPEYRDTQAQRYERRLRGVALSGSYRVGILCKGGGKAREMEVCPAGVIGLDGKPADLVVTRPRELGHPGDEGRGSACTVEGAFAPHVAKRRDTCLVLSR